MDAKDLRTESAVSERNNDGSKYSQGGGITLHCDRNKSYQDIGSNSLGKVDVPNARPCAVIGPDRVVPPPAAREAYHLKKGPVEPWPCMDNAYRRPPEYPHKLTNYQNPTRNISPRQTFQENMQRIMVPPTYNSVKVNEDTNYAQVSDRSNGLSKNIKLNMPPEAKFCDVPYAVNPSNNEHKNVRNPEMCLPSANPTHIRTAPHGWPPGSVNLRSTRMYGAPELYQYQEYPSCAGPRPVVPRPHRTVPEEQGYVYADPYYQEGNLRYKPYPTAKERYPQQRYEYIGNYANPFQPPPGFPSHKYEVQKPMPPHPYPPYPPIKYLDSRVAEPVMEGYQRNPQGLGPNYNIQYRNQVIHPNYGPVVGNGPPSKMHSYPTDAHLKSIPPNKLPYVSNAKAYIEYENSRPKIYPPSDSYFINEMARMPMKSQVIMPNYSALNMHNIPPNPYYKKDAQNIKNYEHMAHFRNMDPNLIHNPTSRHAPVFSPNTLAISPTDSNTSNDTTQTHGTAQEDCGYVSQSSTASVRSIDSGINRLPNEYLRKYYENRYGPIVRTSPMMSKSQVNSNNNNASKDKKQIDVRQFLQMWNEGDEEQEENSKETMQSGSSDKNNFGKSHSHESMSNQQSQEQLYVLGLVNVPSEELAKYEHIQKVSKLPENIKGYNSIELLNQFEEVIESSHMKNYKSPTPKEAMYHMPIKGHLKQPTGVIPPRPVSPLDVEAKISQSVIHKDVGCNFEIKPCSPKMLNVEVAAPVQNILAERSIEKVANPVILRSPMLDGMNENIDCNMMKRTDLRMNMNENLRIPSCKMLNTQYSNSNPIDAMKNSYSIHDLESNSGLCLASLPRLDNDIELNFPEVNQQFINANKGDKTILANSIRDLPTLEVLDQSPNQMNTNSPRREYDIVKSPYMVDSDKEVSKLSKYRKSKTFEPKETLIQHNVNALRTDSVIIKNPENIKNYEENAEFSNGLNKVILDIQQAPINLTSQGSLSNNLENPPDAIVLQVAEKEKHLPAEIAIDFSLNKTGVLNKTGYIDKKNETQRNTSTHMEENHLNTLNKVISTESVHILPVFTEESANLNNKNENCILDTISNSHDVSKPIAVIDKKNNYEVSNKSYKNIECPTDKSVTNVAEEMIVEVSSAQSDTKTEIPGNEHESNIISEKDFCKSKDVRIDELTEDTNNTLVETDSKTTPNLIQNLKENYEMDTAENTANIAIDEDFSDNHIFIDKLKSLVHTETKTDMDTSDINNASEIINPVVAEQAQQPDKKYIISSEETCCDGCESLDLNTSLESQTISKNHGFDHTNINDNTQDSSSQSSEESSDHENDLKDFEEAYCENTQSSRHNFKEIFCTNAQSSPKNIAESNCEDTQSITKNIGETDCEDTQSSADNIEETDCEDTLSSPDNTDLCDIDLAAEESVQHKFEDSVQRNLWYGSKELYSPWIQKLLTFSEGKSNISTKIKDMDSKNDDLIAAAETTKSNDGHGDSNFEKRKSTALEQVTAESDGGHDDSNLESRKSESIEEVTTKNNERDYFEFEMEKSAPIVELTTANKEYDGSDLDMKDTVTIEKVTTEINNDQDESDLEMRTSIPVEKITTGIKEYNDSDFEMKERVAIEKVCIRSNDDQDNSGFETIKSVPVQEVTTENNGHDGIDFEIIKTVPKQEVSKENNGGHNISDFGIAKSIPIQGVTVENNNHYDSDLEIRKSVTKQEVTTDNEDRNISDFESVKSVPTQEVTTENNDQPGLDIRKTVPPEENRTENNYDKDNSNFERRKSVPLDVTIANNYDDNHDDFYLESRKSEPKEKVTAEDNHDHDDIDFDVRKTPPPEEVTTDSNCDSDDSDFEIRNSAQTVANNFDDGHDDPNFLSRKSSPKNELASENNADNDNIDFEIRRTPSEELTTESNCDYDDSDFEIRQSVQPDVTIANNNDEIPDNTNSVPSKSSPKQKATSENNADHYDHDDSDFEIVKPLPIAEETTENNYDKDDSDFETRKLVPIEGLTTENNDDDKVSYNFEINKPVTLEDMSVKNATEDVNVGENNSYVTTEETIVIDVSNPHVLNKNVEENINSNDHFEPEDVSIDEGINHKHNERAVNQDDIMATAGACASEENNIIHPSLHSEPDNSNSTDINSKTHLISDFENQCEAPDTSNIEEILCESPQGETKHFSEQPEADLESSNHFEHVGVSFNGLQANDVPYKKSQRLKRSLSDSALNMYNSDERTKQDSEENVQFIWPFKRRKINAVENDLLAQNLCSIINHNRRNSVSSFYNEDNVSFCILIDNSCIIAEEENEEPEKVCYTELSEECLAEIQNISSTKHDENIETLTEVAFSPQQENVCENADSFMLDCEEDKTLEESWDEDVGCVETVISDDIAEDIEICGPSSPKDDALSDNDESGVFSCSDYTDKVKFIYGDKMCNDDALFVETLYKTPQMDVNKTLYNREIRVSEENDRYYDNDSLEKMLSESNEPPVSPYIPQYIDTMFPPGKANTKETPENKENMEFEAYPPLQGKGNALDIVVDINVDKNERESTHSIEIFAKARNDTANSCESSVDNVFTYNQKDEDAIYTSSSPEVSSTTSEEKNSGILLKITNYQGSRISQINDISRATKRSSCKFTEEKDYLHTHANYSSNRPLLTKAAQKYIPPLRESIGDLKVKLSLPQHSLMKLKQLKISKEEPKVNKPNVNTNPRIPKKPKPKFEDVLKSIDEIQFKKHKEKTKKTKKAIPKVVIKKNRNGSHYASTSNQDDFNPDLTGRKWQPWVFIEKNQFIDKMATRKKTRAVYSHRKKTYVLAEKFQKYKSASSAKFVISPPISDKTSTGLKYTIRLKHNY